MTFDQAQSPRIGQKTPVESTYVRMFSGAEIPEAAWPGQIIFRTDTQGLQVYDGIAWEDVVGGVAGMLTFVGPTPPVAQNTGDLWFDSSRGNLSHRWDGDSWEEMPTGLASLAPDVTARALGSTITTRSPTVPPSPQLGDTWVDTSSGDTIYRWDGLIWQAAADPGPTTAPAASPTFTVDVTFKALIVKTDPIDIYTSLTFEASLDAAFTQISLTVTAKQTYVHLAPLPTGVDLWVRIRAFNDIGTAAASAGVGPFRTLLIDGGPDVKNLTVTMQKFQNSLHLIY